MKEKIYKFNTLALVLFFFVLVAGEIVLMLKWHAGEINPFFAILIGMGSLMGYLMMLTYAVEITENQLLGFYAVGKKRLVAFKAEYKNINRIGYSNYFFMLGHSGKPNLILIQTMIRGYKEILETVITHKADLFIEQRALKELQP